MKETKMTMSHEMAEMIHANYVDSTQEASVNAVEVEENLLKHLQNFDSQNETDEAILDYFLDKLEKSILARKQTFQTTNIVSEILHVCMYIVAWLNSEYQSAIDVDIIARRKSLESELAKLLKLSDEFDPSQIMDRFGIRFILHEGMNTTCFLLSKVVNVLCNLNRQDRKNFLKYIEKFDNFSQYRIKTLLQIPFALEPLSRKDDPSKFDPAKYPDIQLPTEEDFALLKHLQNNMKFYFQPKENGYQSIHIVLGIENTSTILPGVKIEIQFRTWMMDNHAENDINASHDVHKDKIKMYSKVFNLTKEELEETNIRFFTNYRNESNDKDGIHFEKVFYHRRMNNISL